MSTHEHFTLTKDHLTLLHHAYVQWQDCEYGAPGIDPKRPYGNSGRLIERDIALMLGWVPEGSRAEIPEPLRERARRLHEETETALQIVLCTMSFEPGVYRKNTSFMRRSWERVGIRA